jgi:acyl-homoserine lactone acylase PvdQ
MKLKFEMKKRSVLFIISILVLAANYLYTLVSNKFGYHTPLGNKVAISNCKVKADLTGRLTNETIEMHTVDHNMKIVEAETVQGAVFGLGFVHATDRLWQLEFFRKLARGRLSEIFGSETVPIDRYIRTMGVPRMVENYIALVSDQERLILENYVAGVNKVAENLHFYPLEFYMFW